MPRDRRSRPPSLVVPILLVVIGGLFLYASWQPSFDPYPVLATYWPLILIFVGLGLIWDASRRRAAESQGEGAPQPFPIGSTIAVVAFGAAIVILVLHGRAFGHRYNNRHYDRGTEHTSQNVDLQNAKSVHVSIQMGAGQLNISPGASHLLESDFSFSRSWDKPNVEYEVNDGKGELSISQESSGPQIGPSGNYWNLHFNETVPLDLRIDLGAGQSNLKLRDMNLTGLELHMGAGEANVDLTGPRNSDLEADIEGGVGQATVRLPRDVAVVANASGGIGSIRTRGLTKHGDEYVNDSYGKSPHTIRVTVHGGIGQINLEVE